MHKSASLRDRGDRLAAAIIGLADSDKLLTYSSPIRTNESLSVSSSTKDALIGVGYTLSGVEDYRHSSVERIMSKILQTMTPYSSLIPTVRESIKKMMATSTTEGKRNSKDNNSKILTSIPSESEKHALHVDAFEAKKLSDIKRIMNDFLTIQMIFHCKAVETLTKGLQSLGNINELDDLNQFRNHFKLQSLMTESSQSGFQNQKSTVIQDEKMAKEQTYNEEEDTFI
jgi:hypothetical protein